MGELTPGYRNLSEAGQKAFLPGAEVIGPSDDRERGTYDQVEFQHLEDRDSGRVIQNLDVFRCSFEHCRLSAGSNPQLRTRVRKVLVSSCRILDRFGMIGAPILDETTIEDFRAGQILIFWGGVFRRVVLKGRLPSITSTS